MPANTLYYGDNLDILRRYVADESVDLVYLDPPFNGNANYNVLFKEHSGEQAASQIRAFEDTWTWSMEAELALEAMIVEGGQVSVAMQALRKLLGTSNMMAYLAMMAPRLVELRRVLKPTGSIYLHCDPTASHYLKLLMDAVFGPETFRNEAVWQRTGAHSSAKRLGPVHDVLLFYSKGPEYTWNRLYTPHSEEYVRKHYSQTDAAGRRWMPDNLTAAGTRNGSSGQTWRGFDVAAKGNHWKFTQENLERLDAEGRIYWPAKGGWPRYKRYLDEVHGTLLQDVWTDISPINAVAAERLGYPTQKPLALLERIISASSNEGDVRSFHVERVNAATLKPMLAAHIDAETCIMTDEARYYRGIDSHFAEHHTVNHSAGEYARGDITTNTVEGFFSVMKRGLIGTHHHVGSQHLGRYLHEFDFRYNTRKVTDAERMTAALEGIEGKRLYYRGSVA